MAKTKAQIIAEAQVVKNATEVGENTATRVGGVLEDLAEADGIVIIPATGTSSGGNITLSSNPFTQVQTAVNAGQHVVVRVTIASDIIDFSMNTYSASVATYIGTANFLQNGFQLLCNASTATITNRSTSNTFTTGEEVPNTGVDNVPTQGSNNLVKSGGVWEDFNNINETLYGEAFDELEWSTPVIYGNNRWYSLVTIPVQKGDIITFALDSYSEYRIALIVLTSPVNYGTAGSIVTDTGWKTEDLTKVINDTENGYYLRASLSKQNNGTLSLDEVNAHIIIKKAERASTEKKGGLVEQVNQITQLYNELSRIEIKLPEFEMGYIATNGSLGSSNAVARSTSFIRIPDGYDSLSAKDAIDVLQEIVPAAVLVDFNIHCYNANQASLGRALEGYQIIGEKLVSYTLQPATKYVKFTFAINKPNINFDDYIPSINASRSAIFSVVCQSSILDRVDTLEQELRSLNGDALLRLPFSNTGNTSILGNPIKVGCEYNHAQIGTLSSGVSSRQGGAIYGDYLFQFHNTLQNIIVFNLATLQNVQTITLTPISKCHAGSGGFSATFYSNEDTFPLLYISSMDEKKIYVLRLVGDIGALTASIIQTITLNVDFFLPNVAIDARNGRGVLFGYSQNSWGSPAGNDSIFAIFELPGTGSDITISTFLKKFKLPFLYAQQGGFADCGLLYLSFGNTQQGLSTGGVVVIDYINANVNSYMDMRPLSSSSVEPEMVGVYGNSLIVTAQSGAVYKLDF